MSKFEVGDPALYDSTFGKILGKIAGFGTDEMGEYTKFKVTSRKNRLYPHGLTYAFYDESALHPREVRK